MNLTTKMHDELMYAANFYGNPAGVVRYCPRQTEGALLRRGLITYDVTVDHSPVITVEGWEYLASKGFERRGDVGRLTLEDALAEAFPVTVIGEDDMRSVVRRIRERAEKKEIVLSTDKRVTPEVIKALAALRNNASNWNSLRQAADVLDNAGIFAPIDEATGYDVESTCTCPSGYDFINGGVSAQHRPSCPEAPVSKCTCPELSHRTGLHLNGCPGDPAEYGDMAYKVAPEGRRYCPADGCTLHFKVNKDGTLHKHLNDMLEPCSQKATPATGWANPQTLAQKISDIH